MADAAELISVLHAQHQGRRSRRDGTVSCQRDHEHPGHIDFACLGRHLRFGGHLAQDLVLHGHASPRAKHFVAQVLSVVQAPQEKGQALRGVLLRSPRELTQVEEVADKFPQQRHGIQARAVRVRLRGAIW